MRYYILGAGLGLLLLYLPAWLPMESEETRLRCIFGAPHYPGGPTMEATLTGRYTLAYLWLHTWPFVLTACCLALPWILDAIVPLESGTSETAALGSPAASPH